MMKIKMDSHVKCNNSYLNPVWRGVFIHTNTNVAFKN